MFDDNFGEYSFIKPYDETNVIGADWVKPANLLG